MLSSCPHCQLSTAGSHQPGCPFARHVQFFSLSAEPPEKPNQAPAGAVYGWICPRCHRSHAPNVKRCDCQDPITNDKGQVFRVRTRGLPGQ